MVLIADCGSTKIDWCVLNGDKLEKRFFSTGVNALLMPEEKIRETFEKELAPEVKDFSIDEVYYYGAGCLSDEICSNVSRSIAACVPGAKTISVNSDLLAAARALCGTEPGDVLNQGYILGDEGSGAVLGKLLVGDVLKNQLPKALCEKFLKEYNLDRMAIIQKVYKEPAANRFLASLSPFLIQNIEEPAIHRLVLNAFKAFFVRNIENYEGYKQLPVSFVGSVAHYYRDVLGEAAKALDITIGNIIKSPMEGLLKYHSK